MPYPFFQKGLSNLPSTPAAEITSLDRSQIDRPSYYQPHPDLSHAVNVALLLGMPLLLTGEPGTGKTQLAYALGEAIGCPILKFETKSTSQARDLFYTYDALAAFKMKDETDAKLFIRYHALGQAILDSFDNSAVAHLLPPNSTHYGPRRVIVLIDEVDKAPRDFPNDLLNEIDRLYFRIPELGNLATPNADDPAMQIPASYRPIVILTSNSEKGLPDPFLRRCIYFDIPFPTPLEMSTIVDARIGGLQSGDPLVRSAMDLFYKLRRSGRVVSLSKQPSTAEFLNWLQVLRALGLSAGDSLSENAEILRKSLSVLIKSNADHQASLRFIEERWLKGLG